MPDTFNASVTCSGGTTSTSSSIRVNEPAGAQITINWNASNATFPTNINDAFSWKSGSPTPGKKPTRVSDTQLQLNYTMPQRSVSWQYTISLANCNPLDPEIDNQVKPPGEEEKPEKPKKDR
jgi:hypothetical protein